MPETSTEIAVRAGGALAVGAEQTEWTEQQLAVLRSAGVSEDVTAAELTAFLHESQRTGLDPFSKQIYLIGRRDKRAGREIFRSQTGIDGYRVVAHRAARRDGVRLSYADTLWCGPDGAWRDVWLAQAPPAAAKITVYRDGEAFPAVATLAEYAARYPSGDPYPMWAKMPATMLAKCAEALALRKAFPHDLSGIYTAEEMEQADARSAPQELTVEQAARKVRRNHPDAAGEDDWTTQPPDEAGEAGERVSTQDQRKAIVVLIEKKRGVRAADRGPQRTVVSGMLGHPVRSFTDLTLAEASALIDKLTRMDDHIADAEFTEGERQAPAPNPRNGGGPVPDVTAAALGTPSLSQLLADESEGGRSVYDQLIALVADAPTLAHIDRLGEVATQAVAEGDLTAQQFGELAPIAQARREDLHNAAGHQGRPQGWSARLMAQMEEAHAGLEHDGEHDDAGYNPHCPACQAESVEADRMAAAS